MTKLKAPSSPTTEMTTPSPSEEMTTPSPSEEMMPVLSRADGGLDSSERVARAKTEENTAIVRLEESSTFSGSEHHLPSAALTPRPLEQLGHFSILREIGRGGMGVTYKALDTRLDRVVALKMMLSDGRTQQPISYKRFQQEAKALAALHHPNIVSIHEYGEIEGRPFLSMRFVEGQPLESLIRHHPLDGRRAAGLVAKIGQTIQAAHDVGIIHRDLKPSNILLDQQGEPHIIDFGLAKHTQRDQGLTRPDTVMGTPAYIAPEQIASSDAVGPLADIYALGGILYKLLTCRPPFQGANPFDTLRQASSQDPLPLRLLNQAAPHALEAICMKCLQKNPAERYPSAQALAEDLQAFLRGDPIDAHPHSSVASFYHLLVRPTEHIEVIAAWHRLWTLHGTIIFAMFLMLQFLYSTGVMSFEPYALILGVVLSFLAGSAWWARWRFLSRLTPLERQMTKLWFIFALCFVLTAWMNSLLKLPNFKLLPIVLLQIGVAFACMATILRGEFFLIAIFCGVMALLSPWLMDVIFLVMGFSISVGFWLPGYRLRQLQKTASSGQEKTPRL